MTENNPRLPYNLPNDPAEFDATVRRGANWLRRKFGPGVRATTAIHDVLLKGLYKHANGEELPSRGFWQAVIRRVFDQFRRNRRHERFLAHQKVALEAANGRHLATSSCEDELKAQELQSAIDRVVGELSPTDRDLWARLGNGETHQEIANATGKTATGIKQAAYRIRLRILNGLPEEYQPVT